MNSKDCLLYHLTFTPGDESAAQTYVEMENLNRPNLDTFSFIPPQ